MNTKTKIAIAAAIGLALVVLIVMDQGAAPTEQTAETGDVATQTFTTPAPGTANDAEERYFQSWTHGSSESEPVVERAEPTLSPTIKDPSPPSETKKIPATPTADEYVIRQGDTYEGIARRKYGDATQWQVIAKANPNVKPYALQVGKKIVIPARPQATTTPSVQVEAESNQRDASSYLVEAGDTLEAISKKVYKTAAYAMQIFKANAGTLSSPDMLRVGMKLNIPRVETTDSVARVADPVSPTNSAPGKIHEVRPNDNLWKIAMAYRGGRTIPEMMQAIVKANPGKLTNESSTLRVGWKLAIPE